MCEKVDVKSEFYFAIVMDRAFMVNIITLNHACYVMGTLIPCIAVATCS